MVKNICCFFSALWLRRACETNDEVLLEKAVGDVDGFKKNYAAAYMVAMKKLNNYDLTKAAETIQKVNSRIDMILDEIKES